MQQEACRRSRRWTETAAAGPKGGEDEATIGVYIYIYYMYTEEERGARRCVRGERGVGNEEQGARGTKERREGKGGRRDGEKEREEGDEGVAGREG